MEKLQFENEQFILHSPDSLKYITDNMQNILTKSFEYYKILFDVDTFRKFQINYFDDIEKFRNYIYDLRGEKESLPKYAKGTYDDGMVNAYTEPDTQLKRLYTASHELFHILYMKYILKNDYR